MAIYLFHIISNVETKQKISSEIHIGNKPDQYFLDLALLSCKNDDVDDLNDKILSMFPGDKTILISANSVVLESRADGDFNSFPMEYLNSLKVSGLSLAHLALKEGCPLMLLHNLNPSNGLYNGACMILIRIQSHVLQCHMLGGEYEGKMVFIPQISLEPSNEELPIKFHC
jgi:ATP-dependent DNA helicase PIF1